jgi:hypothetical protein
MATQADPGPAPSGRPTGTVTFLFSDIEGSTQHWEDQRATMATVLRRHDELIRNAIETHGGHVFKTMATSRELRSTRVPMTCTTTRCKVPTIGSVWKMLTKADGLGDR